MKGISYTLGLIAGMHAMLYSSLHQVRANEFTPKGVYVDHIEFSPGRGFLDHHIPDKKQGIGPPKDNVYRALSLGRGGSAEVAYTGETGNVNLVRCFHNPNLLYKTTGRPAFWVHEPELYNDEEPFAVWVNTTKEKDPSQWFYLGTKSIKDGIKGFIPLELKTIMDGGTEVQIPKAYWIRIVDQSLNGQGEENTKETQILSPGFDLSTVIITAACDAAQSKIDNLTILEPRQTGLESKLSD